MNIITIPSELQLEGQSETTTPTGLRKKYKKNIYTTFLRILKLQHNLECEILLEKRQGHGMTYRRQKKNGTTTMYLQERRGPDSIILFRSILEVIYNYY